MQSRRNFEQLSLSPQGRAKEKDKPKYKKRWIPGLRGGEGPAKEKRGQNVVLSPDTFIVCSYDELSCAH